jgi:hypothetical protein
MLILFGVWGLGLRCADLGFKIYDFGFVIMMFRIALRADVRFVI